MPKKFVVKATSGFAKSLDELPPRKALQIAGKLKTLKTVPLPTGKNRIKKLRGYNPPLYRLRVGDKRILYRISGGEVILLKIVDRKKLKKELKKYLL